MSSIVKKTGRQSNQIFCMFIIGLVSITKDINFGMFVFHKLFYYHMSKTLLDKATTKAYIMY